MSLLFKKILGQNVVHPVPKSQADESTKQTAEDGKKEPVRSSSQADAGSREPARAAVVAKKDAATSSDPRRRTTTPTHTLLTRLKTCVVAQDMRDTLKELQNCDDLITGLLPEDLEKDIMPLLERFSDDEDVVNTTMKLLSRITASYEDEACVAELNERERRTIRAGFLLILIPQIPLLVTQLRRTHIHFFWSRFYAVQILAHLEDQDPSATNKQLLECHGLGVLVDVLTDTSKDGLLRNEALRLLATLTATDAEMQTILAFENGFDSLFVLIHSLGDVESGAQATVVIECLTIIHNLLRSNKAAGKLFREMGSAQHLRPLLEVVTARLQRAQQQQSEQARRAGGNRGVNGPAGGGPGTASATSATLYTKFTASESTIILMAVSVLGCLLRQCETGTESEEARRAALDCGVLRPLTCVALSGDAVDDATRIESLRTVTAYVRGSQSKRVAQEVLDQPVLVMRANPLSSSSPQEEASSADERKPAPSFFRWGCCRALLNYLLCSEDKTMIAASTQLVLALLESNRTSSGGLRVTESFMDGFFESCTPNAVSDDAATRGGFLLATALLGPGNITRPSPSSSSPIPSVTARYYAAHLVEALVRQPGGASVVCQPVFRNAPGPEGTLPLLNPSLFLTPAVPPTVLNALMCLYVASVQHHRERSGSGGDSGSGGRGNDEGASRGDGTASVDLHTLSALSQLLLTILVEYPPATAAVLNEPQWLIMLLQEAQHAGTVAHVRFWCAALAGQLCLAAPSTVVSKPTRNAPNSAPSLSQEDVLQRFVGVLGNPAPFFDALLFDVRASGTHYGQPATDAFGGNQRVLYDARFVEALDAVVSGLKALSPAHQAAPPPPPPVVTHDDDQHSRLAQAQDQPPSWDRQMAAAQPKEDTLAASHDAHNDPINQRASHNHTSERSAEAPRQSSPPHLDASAKQDQQHPNWALLEGRARAAEEVAEERTAQVESLQAQLDWQVRELESRQEELAELRVSKERLEEQLALWKTHADRLEAAHQEALTEVGHIQEEDENKETLLRGLRDNVEALQDALAAKDETERQLQHAMRAMETRLDDMRVTQTQLQEENQVLRTARSAVQQATAAPEPQAPMVPVVDPALLDQLAQRDRELEALRSHVAQMEMEAQALRQDRDDLLLLVGEVEVECESLRATSTAVTPARPLSLVRPPRGDTNMEQAALFAPAPGTTAAHDEAQTWQGHEPSSAQFEAFRPQCAPAPPSPHSHTASQREQSSEMNPLFPPVLYAGHDAPFGAQLSSAPTAYASQMPQEVSEAQKPDEYTSEWHNPDHSASHEVGRTPLASFAEPQSHEHAEEAPTELPPMDFQPEHTQWQEAPQSVALASFDEAVGVPTTGQVSRDAMAHAPMVSQQNANPFAAQKHPITHLDWDAAEQPASHWAHATSTTQASQPASSMSSRALPPAPAHPDQHSTNPFAPSHESDLGGVNDVTGVVAMTGPSPVEVPHDTEGVAAEPFRLSGPGTAGPTPWAITPAQTDAPELLSDDPFGEAFVAEPENNDAFGNATSTEQAPRTSVNPFAQQPQNQDWIDLC